ncbi:MAG: tyrosine-type recombinase/integrase [Halopseudomonas aestusnigri]
MAISLQDYINKLDETPNKELSKNSNAAMKSALVKLTKIFRADGNPQYVQAVPRIIIDRLEQMSPVDAGLKPSSFSTFKSNIRRALREVTVEGKNYNCAKDLPNEWSELLGLVDSKEYKYRRININGFAKGANALGILPKGLQENFYPLYVAFLKNNTLDKSPETRARAHIQAWNWAISNVDGFMGIKLALPQRDVFIKSLSDFPKSFQGEVEKYRDILSNPGKYITNKNIRNRKRALGVRSIEKNKIRFLREGASHLIASGIAIQDITSISDVVHPAKIQIIAKCLEEKENNDFVQKFKSEQVIVNGLMKTSSSFNRLRTLRTIALDLYAPNATACAVMDQVVESARTISVVINGRKIERRMKTKGLTAKNKERLAQFNKKGVLEELGNFPRMTFDNLEVERKKRGGEVTLTMAYRFQEAIAVMLLFIRPLRREDLVSLHLRDDFSEKPLSNGYVSKFEFFTRKTGAPVVLTLKSEASRYLKLYLKFYLPIIARGISTDWVFPGQGCRAPVDPSNFSNRVTRAIKRHVGVKMNMHLFRHLMATLLIKEDERNISLVTETLCHSSEMTARLAYHDGPGEKAMIRKDIEMAKIIPGLVV